MRFKIVNLRSLPEGTERLNAEIEKLKKTENLKENFKKTELLSLVRQHRASKIQSMHPLRLKHVDKAIKSSESAENLRLRNSSRLRFSPIKTILQTRRKAMKTEERIKIVHKHL